MYAVIWANKDACLLALWTRVEYALEHGLIITPCVRECFTDSGRRQCDVEAARDKRFWQIS